MTHAQSIRHCMKGKIPATKGNIRFYTRRCKALKLPARLRFGFSDTQGTGTVVLGIEWLNGRVWRYTEVCTPEGVCYGRRTWRGG